MKFILKTAGMSHGMSRVPRALRHLRPPVLRPTLVVLLALSSCFSMILVLDAETVPTPQQTEYFEKYIRPVLVKHCYECHAQDSKTVRGGLLLDTRDGIRRGGDSGPAVVPAKPDASLLLEAMRYEAFEMPPAGKLAADTIARFEKWIRDGAADPRVGGGQVEQREIDLNAGRQFWAFRPVVQPRIPPVENGSWPRSSIDRFVLSRLEAENTLPGDDADAATLLRRAKFDLLGLPPTPAETRSFAREPSQAAFQRRVDDWLSSPQFGRRWGRHWLDVARFAESSGGGRSLMFPEAWRYRDYVVSSFNADVPFDQFIREQVAGDLLPHSDASARDRHIIATGFLTLGPTNYELQDKALLEMEVVDEQIDTLGRAFLGLTLGCARCHDHKFDPIPMTDYYALAGIFASTETVEHGNVSKYVEQTVQSDPQWPRFELAQKQIAEKNTALESIQKRIRQLKAARDELAAPGIVVDDDREKENERSLLRTQIAAAETRAATLQQQLKAAQAHAPRKPTAMSVRDRTKPADIPLLIRGEIRKPGPLVRRGFVSVACRAADLDGRPENAPIPAGSSGRLELAEWLASPQNPLTARVMANRIWHHLMGNGLVRTTDNFGAMGDRPSHPELLDFLAADFLDSGWSVKTLVRRIMLSRVYQLDSGATAAQIAADPQNRLLARANPRRLDAEAIRDAMLTISGQLETTTGGLTINKITQYDLDYQFDSRLRSVYVPRFRNSVLDIFQTFDVANPNMVTGRRNTSVLPTQALFLLNSEFVAEQAELAARRLLNEVADDSSRFEEAFLMTLGRWPTAPELRLMASLPGDGRTDADQVEKWNEVFHLLFGSIDFRYLH